MRLILNLILLVGITYQIKNSCLDENKKNQKWIASLRFPGNIKNHQNQFAQIKSSQNVLKVVENFLDVESQWLYNTLSQVNMNKKLQVVAWNDISTEGQRENKAHSKGILVLDEATDSGFYLMHSIPKYPGISKSGKLDIKIKKPQSIFGQHLICVSLSGSQVDKVAYNNIFAKQNIYYSPANSKKYKNFNIFADEKLSKMLRQQSPDRQQIVNKITPEWTLLTKTASNSLPQIQLWDDLVLREYNVDLVCETWGRPLDKSYCKHRKVLNAKSVKISNEITWDINQDHSKYCVEKTKGKYLVCFGDMNRMESQRKREGGALCTQNKHIWEAMQIFNATEKCKPQKSLFQRLFYY